jgi:hypothetical protein
LDECQNLTASQLKTIITRCGEGTKLICSGNLSQIDSNYLTPYPILKYTNILLPACFYWSERLVTRKSAQIYKNDSKAADNILNLLPLKEYALANDLKLAEVA